MSQEWLHLRIGVLDHSSPLLLRSKNTDTTAGPSSELGVPVPLRRGWPSQA